MITREKRDYHFQTNGKFAESPIEEYGLDGLTSEAYQAKLHALREKDYKYEIIFGYKPNPEQLWLWIRAFAPDKEEEFFSEIWKKLEEFD